MLMMGVLVVVAAAVIDDDDDNADDYAGCCGCGYSCVGGVSGCCCGYDGDSVDGIL